MSEHIVNGAARTGKLPYQIKRAKHVPVTCERCGIAYTIQAQCVSKSHRRLCKVCRHIPVRHQIVPLFIAGKVAVVALGKGHRTLVDASDWPLVSNFNWRAIKSGHS